MLMTHHSMLYLLGKINYKPLLMRITSYKDFHYSYELIDNKLRLYPTPDDVSAENFWFRFTVEDNDAFATGSYDSGVNGINNMNTMPMENIAFNKINSIGQQWIRRFVLALSKRNFLVKLEESSEVAFQSPEITSPLMHQTYYLKHKQSKLLREELNKQLDEMLYAKIAETDKAMVDNMDSIVGKTPLKILWVIKCQTNGKDQHKPPPPLFLGEKEKNLVKQVNDEIIERVVGQQILYFAIDVETTNFHPLYGEAIEKNFLHPIRVFALVEYLGVETSFMEGIGIDKKTV